MLRQFQPRPDTADVFASVYAQVNNFMRSIYHNSPLFQIKNPRWAGVIMVFWSDCWQWTKHVQPIIDHVPAKSICTNFYLASDSRQDSRTPTVDLIWAERIFSPADSCPVQNQARLDNLLEPTSTESWYPCKCDKASTNFAMISMIQQIYNF